MDVPPPWYELTEQGCSGDVRRCGGGDAHCRQQAVKDGYVAVSLYDFCRRDEVHTVPRPGSVPLLLGLLLFLALCAAVAFAVWRRRRAPATGGGR